MNKLVIGFALFWFGLKPGLAQLSFQTEPFSLQEIRLLDGPFKQAEELDIQYLLELDADKLLAPYCREAGIPWKATSYGNWENTGLDGHIGGHYLSTLSLMYASTGDTRIRQRLDYMLEQLERCQKASGNGYLGGIPGGKAMWQEVAAGKIKAGGFDLNKKWVPLYNIHKIYAGLRDAWVQTGSLQAREMLIRLTDWMIQEVADLSDEQIQELLRSEHGGLNEIFADVAAITGDHKYLHLARQFSHRLILEPLLKQEDKLNGLHANTQIPKVIGFERIAQIDGDTLWHEAACFFWETVVNHRSVSIGGNSVREHFHPSTDFSVMMKSEQGPETCNTYNMLRLSKMLYQVSGEEHYIDYYERALYNHILSTQNPRQGGFVYFTPMRSGHYRVYSQPQTSFWCCVGSGLENHAKYGEMIYAHSGNNVYVNLFIPSRLNWKKNGLEILQRTSFPDGESIELIINPQQASKFTLYLRYPVWVKAGKLTLTVNEKAVAVTQRPGDYIVVNRRWKKGDRVRLQLPMSLYLEQLPDSSAWYSVKYGPIVLAAKTDSIGMKGLFADDSRGGHIASGGQVPLQDMPVMVGNPDQALSHIQSVEGKPLTFVMNGLYPAKYGQTELIPFFRLHESRYILYWPLLSSEQLQQRQTELAKQEELQAHLNAITADYVICGEQQPESDHFIQAEESKTGLFSGRHWRETLKEFSYQLKNSMGEARVLRLTICGRESAGRACILWINGEKVADVKIPRDTKDPVLVLEYNLTGKMTNDKQLMVKIAAEGAVTPRVCEVRLLTK